MKKNRKQYIYNPRRIIDQWCSVRGYSHADFRTRFHQYLIENNLSFKECPIHISFYGCTRYDEQQREKKWKAVEHHRKILRKFMSIYGNNPKIIGKN